MDVATRSPTEAAQETQMREIIYEFNSTVARLGDLRNRIGGAAERLLGSIPEPGETKPGPVSVPGSLVEELRSCLSRSQEAIERAESYVTRIERAV